MKKFFYGLFVMMVILLTGLVISEGTKADEKNWNHGICTSCGGALQFKSASHYNVRVTYYYWECDNCGHIVETITNMRGE